MGLLLPRQKPVFSTMKTLFSILWTPVRATGEPDALGQFFERTNTRVFELIRDTLGLTTEVATLTTFAIGTVLIFALAFSANFIAKRLILRIIDKIVRRTRWSWDQQLHEAGFFTRLSHLAPAFVIHLLGRTVFAPYPTVGEFVDHLVSAYVVIILLMVVSAFLNALRNAIDRSKMGANVPVKGFFQAIKLIIFIIGTILVLSVIFGKSPVYFLSGLTALTAVLLLIFRDALLGLVAGVMISVNQMVRIGDWIEMPGNGADGDVIDVSLTTVKVRNWDQTITTIPSYDLIAKSFKNYRGMFEAGGRRIKRSLYIDMRSVRFVDPALLEKLQRIRLLRPYLEAKLKEVEEENNAPDLDLEVLCNGRRLTNLGTFRAYCVAYLQHRGDEFRQDMISLVRQLAPTEHGLPLEIYVFTTDTRWVVHERVQADLFDHLLAVIEEFDLRIFQDPSGSDLARLLQSRTSSETRSSTA